MVLELSLLPLSGVLLLYVNVKVMGMLNSIHQNLYTMGVQGDSETSWVVTIFVISLDVLIFLLISLFFTHRIVGPSYKIKLMLTKIKEGDFTTRIYLRDKDHLNDLASTINDITETQHNSLKQLKEVITSLKDQMDDSTDKQIKDKVDELQASLSRFTL
jgi:methyl-accepting chemotaxis protein